MVFLKYKDISKYLNVTSTTLNKWSANGDFPERIELGPRINAWKSKDVYDWFLKKGITIEEWAE